MANPKQKSIIDILFQKNFQLILLSLVLGPLAAFSIGIPNVMVYLTDVLVFINLMLWTTKLPVFSGFITHSRVFQFFLIFILIAFISLGFSPVQLAPLERLTSLLYLIRFASYGSIGLTTFYLIKHKRITKENVYLWLGTIGIFASFIGWLQYYLYDDLRNLYYLGWDPHYKRIFSFYFDPNFFGIILVFSLLTVFLQFKKNIVRYILFLFLFITLAFTYSRSSFLSFLGGGITYSLFRRKYKIGILLFCLIVGAVILLPRPGGEGVRLERIYSALDRIESWKLSISMWSRHPILGVGFNTIRYAKREFGVSWEDLQSSHAGAGFDSSLLFVGVTTGVVGLFVFLKFLFELFKQGSSLLKVSLIALLIHSLFLNSLFYPWVLVWIWIVAFI